MPSKDRHNNFALMRDRVLAAQDGKPDGKLYWRSLEELADSPEFREFVEREYPQQAEEWNDPVGRRTFIKLMGASLALAGLNACVYQPPEKIVPYVNQPEDIVPGKPLYFATAMPFGGVATPLLVRSNEGRPTKVEGNPDHPNNLNADLNQKGTSATDLFAQASILTLYDPDRSQTLTYREEIRPWTAFVAEINSALEEQRKAGGAGLRFLTETVTSPTLGNQLKAILTEFPQARWHQYEPAGRGGAHGGAMAAFGEAVNTTYRFDQAERILAIDSDFLSCGPGNLRYARDFAAKRRLTEERKEMNRLYAIESTPTNTGAMADHRFSVRPSEIEPTARMLAAMLGNTQIAGTATAPTPWISAVARDLQQYQGRSIVIAGDEQPASVHALAHSMNQTLGNVGKTVFYTEPIEARPEDHTQSLRDLVNDIDNGRVQMLIILGGNPVYTTPIDLKLDQARMSKINLRVHLSLYKDETSELCHWHVPEAHYLEAWSDTRSYDGTVSIVQPLIEPLYNGRSAHEFLAVFSNQFDRRGYDIVREFWQGQMGGGGGGQKNQAAAVSQTPASVQATATPAPASNQAQNGAGNQAMAFADKPILTAPIPNAATDFEAAWRKVLHDGFIPNTATKAREGLSVKAPGQGGTTPAPAPQAPASGFEIVFRTDPSVYDGRFSNNGWLQELPKPQNKLTWDNAALISPATAKQLGIGNKIGTHGGDVHVDTITIEYAGRTVTAPTWVTPGQPDNVVTVHLGYGRTRAGRVGNGAGFDAYALRTADSPWFGGGVKVTKTGEQYSLAVTQLHHLMENRDPVRVSTLEKHLENESHPKEKSEGHGEERGESSYDESMYPRYDYTQRDYAWGMAIDVSSCVGCNACVVACQSENNIAVVGKEQVQRSREMHWLRIDSYFGGNDENNPEGPYFMPVPCMHCEQAPCEPVCPVHATVHSAEGLNDMVYNRCVGTRYCSNNCPYKVRHFNFLLYQDWNTPTYQLMRNPEVTIRSRGVMEKCTYCVQRIQWGKIEAEKEGRKVADGEVVTACQSVCPTEAIIFGNINDPESRVSKLKAEERNYSLLSDLNTQPRTTYLSALKNPNKELSEKKA
ncbi:MAG TPA: TAT-variant-translocated molybdopterin oxidoreductase [Pyrinomonadaceae bacterium]|nr:TAT-variant-translocated molybdopterin oxidoreductase [Pyrinomonadaceae bacterium]